MQIDYKNTLLEFETNEDVFSPKDLDMGTKTMLNHAEIKDGDQILDLGCGFGFVGIYYAKLFPSSKVTLVDISENAVKLSKKNAQLNGVAPTILESDGFNALKNQTFDVVLSNPPYHADFSVPKAFIESAYRQLNMNGKLYMVTKRRIWYENKIRSVFGYVKVIEENGYCVFYTEKRERKKNSQPKNRNKLSKKLQRKYSSNKRNNTL